MRLVYKQIAWAGVARTLSLDTKELLAAGLMRWIIFITCGSAKAFQCLSEVRRMSYGENIKFIGKSRLQFYDRFSCFVWNLFAADTVSQETICTTIVLGFSLSC